MPVYEKYTYTDGQYFCNRCDAPHEEASIAEACYDEQHADEAICEHCPKVAPGECGECAAPVCEDCCSDNLCCDGPRDAEAMHDLSSVL